MVEEGKTDEGQTTDTNQPPSENPPPETQPGIHQNNLMHMYIQYLSSFAFTLPVENLSNCAIAQPI